MNVDLTAQDFLRALEAANRGPSTAGEGSDTYSIALEATVSFLGRRADALPALLIPLEESVVAPGVATSSLLLMPSNQVAFDIKTAGWIGPAAILLCRQKELVQTFAILSYDVSSSLAGLKRKPRWSDVVSALARWQQLLAAASTLGPDREMGLWGELWIISTAPDPLAAFDTWQGSESQAVDFVGGGIGLECKTSRWRLRHHVSQSQIDQPLGDYPMYLMSLWVGDDPVVGVTLPDLVAKIDAFGVDVVKFEAKLLAVGYRRADAPCYGQRLVLLEAASWIPMDSVPRVRAADSGVSQLRYVVDLPGRDLLDSSTRDHLSKTIWPVARAGAASGA